MGYWLPPKLALPQRTTTLLFRDDLLDRGAAWAINAMLKAKTSGDPYTLDPEAWQRFLSITLKTYRPPTWMERIRRAAQKRPKAHIWLSGSRLQEYWHATLPTWQASPRFTIIALPFLTENSYAFSSEEERLPGFLVARHEGDRTRIYPRTLRTRTWSALPSNILRRTSMPRLERLWDAAFDALPAFALTEAHKHAGDPFIAASLPAPAYQQSHIEASGPTIHPYWRHAQHSLCAAWSMHRLTPPPPDTYDRTFYWNVYSSPSWSYNHTHPTRYAPLPLRVELTWNGWRTNPNDKDPDPTLEQSKKLQAISLAMGTLLTRMAPDVPLFFDSLTIEGGASQGFYRTGTIDISDVGGHYPWIDRAMVEGAGSVHHAMRHLAALPPAWSTALTQACHTSMQGLL